MPRPRCLLALALAIPAVAQDEPPTDPELSDPSIDQIVREMIDGTSPADAISPRSPERAMPAGQLEGPLLPGFSIEGYEIGAPRILPENTFITRRQGRLLRLSGGDWAFVFHEADEATLPPMIVLPCRELERVESVIEDPSIGDVFAASGRVFAYHGRNYLLPDMRHGLLPVQIEAEAAEPDGEAAPVESVLEPEIAEIVKALEAERDAHRPLTPLQVTEGAEVLPSSVKEGTFVVRRRGRLVRLGDGQWAFMMDADAGDDSTKDPALVITPCQTLMLMERLAADRGENLVIELTGHTLVYKHRAFMVPMMYQVVFEENVRPLQ